MVRLLDIGLAVLVTAIGSYFSFSLTVGATPMAWYLYAGPALLLGAYAALRFAKRRELAAALQVKAGDFTLGVLAAVAVYGAAWLVAAGPLGPGKTFEPWLVRAALQFGAPSDLADHSILVAVALVAVAISQELMWRGLVMTNLEAVGLPPMGAAIVGALLYALAHGPTVVALAAAPVGLNPLVVLVSLVAGVVWGIAVSATKRLPPAMLSHAVVTWAVFVAAPLWGPAASIR